MATPKLTQAEMDYQLSRPHETWAHGISAYRITFLIVVEIAVILRMWGRRFQKISLKSDDYTLIAAAILTCAHAICGVLSVKYGYGHHTLDIPKATFPARTKAGYAANVFYTIGFPLSRISLTLLYKRIFVKKWFGYVCWFMISCFCCYSIATLFLNCFNVIPVRAQWTPGMKIEHSIDGNKQLYANTCFNIASGAILLALPLFMVWKLQMRKLAKMGISFIFCLGALDIIASGMRLYYALKYKKSKDPGWTGKNGSYWTITEFDLGILCPCLVTFQPVLIFFYRFALSQLSPRNQGRVSRITRVDPNIQPTEITIGGNDDEVKRIGSDESESTKHHNNDGYPSSSLNSKPSDIEAQTTTIYEDKSIPPSAHPTSHTGMNSRDEDGMAINQDATLANLDPRVHASDHESRARMGSTAEAGVVYEWGGTQSDLPGSAIGIRKGYQVESSKEHR